MFPALVRDGSMTTSTAPCIFGPGRAVCRLPSYLSSVGPTGDNNPVEGGKQSSPASNHTMLVLKPRSTYGKWLMDDLLSVQCMLSVSEGRG